MCAKYNYIIPFLIKILEQVSVAPENAVCKVAQQNPKKNRIEIIVSSN